MVRFLLFVDESTTVEGPIPPRFLPLTAEAVLGAQSTVSREKIWTKENNPLEWIEGHVEGVTGWAIGDRYDTGIDLAEEANSLYDTLEHVNLPLFYGKPTLMPKSGAQPSR